MSDKEPNTGSLEGLNTKLRDAKLNLEESNKQLLKIAKDYQLRGNLLLIEMREGNQQKALDSYKMALEIINELKTGNEQFKKDLEESIKNLEGIIDKN